MTLREVCNSLQVSRRAIQGYEKLGLILASGKNDRGHLLYDAKTRERIKTIKFYQQLGFSLKEISAIIDAPNEVLKEALETQVQKLQEESEYMEQLIRKACRLISTL